MDQGDERVYNAFYNTICESVGFRAVDDGEPANSDGRYVNFSVANDATGYVERL